MLKFAIANCRVSTAEQKLSNSLNRQEQSVLGAASELGVEVMRWWSGDVSSKAGTNVNRKDLKEMEEFCKKHKEVKYLIVDEPDRFMRSIDEAFYFEVLFRQLDVTVWYACDPNLNTGDLMAKMLKFSKYFPAESSNVERSGKSIRGQTAALKDGRYTFCPKAGYMKGRVKGIPDIHPERGPALQKALKDIAHKRRTILEALKELNNSDYIKTRAPLKIDKFKLYIADPFYSGVVQINKQVKARNEDGLHEKLITPEEHQMILDVLDGTKKNKPYTKKQFNPDYPLNKTWCTDCMGVVEGKIVGFNLSNGRGGVFPRYRCRNCWKIYRREEVHNALNELLDDFWMSEDDVKELVTAMTEAWKNRKNEIITTTNHLQAKITRLEQELEATIGAIIDPANKPYVNELRQKADKIKDEMSGYSNQIRQLQVDDNYDFEGFVKFGLTISQNLAKSWESLESDDLYRFKQLLFPDGFMIGPDKKVYTSKISPIYSLGAIKKDAEASDNSHLVRVMRL